MNELPVTVSFALACFTRAHTLLLRHCSERPNAEMMEILDGPWLDHHIDREMASQSPETEKTS